jgi:hypothetical protein
MIIGAGGDELLAGYSHYFHPFLLHLRDHNRFPELITNLLLKTDLWPKYQCKKRFLLMCRYLIGSRQKLEVYNPVSFFNLSGHTIAHRYFSDSDFINADSKTHGFSCRF